MGEANPWTGPIRPQVPPPVNYQNVYVGPPRKVHHGLHALAAFATCGLSIPFWIWDALRK